MIINLLSQDSDTHITIALQLLEEAEIKSKITTSFFHTQIGEVCIKYKRNMLTASYIKAEMRALDEKAKQAGIVILNEIGLDAGIDYMSAVKMITEIKAKGGVLRSFRSICRGLPAPEFADNPLLLQIQLESARRLKQARIQPCIWKTEKWWTYLEEIYFYTLKIQKFTLLLDGGAYANRDSTSYVESYGLQDATTVFRGTLRYKGYSFVMWSIKELGLLSADSYPGLDRKHPKFSRRLLGFLPWWCFWWNSHGKTVGYPLGIAAELIRIIRSNLEVWLGLFSLRFTNLLKELKHRGVTFVETVV